LLKTKGQDLYRYKGILSVKGVDHKFVFQGVHMIFTMVPLDTWKKDEKRINKFVFIGKNLEKETLKQAFESCKIDETKPLRFQVGSKVKANVSQGWTKGKVIKVWDEGNAYRVRLKDNTEVWAPIDSDDYIRQFNGK